MIAVIIVTAIALLLIETPEEHPSEGDRKRRLIATAITLADMGFLAWLIA